MLKGVFLTHLLLGFLFCSSFLSARVLDDEGHVLPAVAHIFQNFAPLIKDQYLSSPTDNPLRQKLSPAELQTVLDPCTPSCSLSLEDLNTIAQAIFLRPINQERKDLSAQSFLLNTYATPALYSLFTEIGDLGGVYPKEKSPRYILIHGSTLQNMRARVATLIQWVNEGIVNITHSTAIVFLSGARDIIYEAGTSGFFNETEAAFLHSAPLTQDPSWKAPSTFPKTEDEAAEWIWSQSLLPPALRAATVTFVRSPKHFSLNPLTNILEAQRPRTIDTLETWLSTYHPEGGTCLSLSTQPFVYYQAATTRNILKRLQPLSHFSVEGAGVNPFKENEALAMFSSHLAILLDNLARVIYTELH